MANMNLKDALERSLLATKEYIDKNKFSGDYNDLENKPCWVEPGENIEYTYNGDYANAFKVDSSYVKISDDVPTYEQLLSGSYEVFDARQNEVAWTKTIKEHADAAEINIISDNTGSGIFVSNEFCVIDTDGANLKGITFPEKGIYVVDKNGISQGEMPVYVSKIIIQEEIVHQLDEKFIPDTIARVENLPYCDTRTTEPAIITYDGYYPDKQIAVLNETTIQIQCFVRIHDSLSLDEVSDIIAIKTNGNDEKIENLIVTKYNEEATLIKKVDSPLPTYLLNIKSDTVLNISDFITAPFITGEFSLSEGLWVFHIAAKQKSAESLSLKENNEVNVKALGEHYICEVEYNKVTKGNVKRVDEQDYLTTKKYVDANSTIEVEDEEFMLLNIDNYELIYDVELSEYADCDIITSNIADSFIVNNNIVEVEAGESIKTNNLSKRYKIYSISPENDDYSLTLNFLKLVNSFNVLNLGNLNTLDRLYEGNTDIEIAPSLDTSNVTSMNEMFNGCTNLIEVPEYNTSNVTSMNAMFYSCENLRSVPLFDTSEVTNMQSMFFGCRSLTEVPNFDTSSVTSMGGMFQSCQSLTNIPSLDVSKVSDLSSLFNGCASLVDVTMCDTSNVSNMRFMLNGCKALKNVTFNNTGNVTNFTCLFQTCTVLENIYNLNVSSASNVSYMFAFCDALKYIELVSTDASKITKVVNQLPTHTGAAENDYIIDISNCSTEVITALSSLARNGWTIKTV